MADAKKEAHGTTEVGGWQKFSDVAFWLLLALVGLSLLGIMFNKMTSGFSFPDISSVPAFILNQFQVFSIFFSLLFFIGIFYCNFLTQSFSGHHHATHAHTESVSQSAVHREPDKRWQDILNKLNSPNEGDWRLAVIEADIILEDMLSRMGYFGEGIAEKLKTVEPSDFKTLDLAWEAHKVRNRIAHSGLSYKLSKSEAEKTIKLFEKVFEEFFFI